MRGHLCIEREQGPAGIARPGLVVRESTFPPEEFGMQVAPFLPLSAIFAEYDPEPDTGGLVAVLAGNVIGAELFDTVRFDGRRGEKEQGGGGT